MQSMHRKDNYLIRLFTYYVLNHVLRQVNNLSPHKIKTTIAEDTFILKAPGRNRTYDNSPRAIPLYVILSLTSTVNKL